MKFYTLILVILLSFPVIASKFTLGKINQDVCISTLWANSFLPRVVAIRSKTSQFGTTFGSINCSGIALNDHEILTSANCIQDGEDPVTAQDLERFNPKSIEVIYLIPPSARDENFKYDRSNQINVKKITVHEDYKMVRPEKNIGNATQADLAILTLSSALPLSNISGHKLLWPSSDGKETKKIIAYQHPFSWAGYLVTATEQSCSDNLKTIRIHDLNASSDKIYVSDPLTKKQHFGMMGDTVNYIGGAYLGLTKNGESTLYGIVSSSTILYIRGKAKLKTTQSGIVRVSDLSKYKTWIDENSDGLQNL